MELYRALIPSKHIINDNHGQHYRIHMGNIEWITQQYKDIKSGDRLISQGRGIKPIVEYYTGPGGFTIPKKENIPYLKEEGKQYKIRCEIWKPRNLRFDPQNYAKTFKAPIDMLVHDGYIPDDSWKYVTEIAYCGGGPDIWKERAYRYENDGLPDELTVEWWNTMTDDYNDILIRIIVE